jgi:hypothetical protein
MDAGVFNTDRRLLSSSRNHIVTAVVLRDVRSYASSTEEAML